MSPKTHTFPVWLRWSAWLVVVILAAYETILTVSPSVLLKSIESSLSISAGEFGAVSAAYFYVYAPSLLIVGLLMDRVGPRVLIPISAISLALGALVFGLAPNLGTLAAGRLICGGGGAFVFTGICFLAAHLFPKQRVAFMIGLANMIIMIGAFVGEGPVSLLNSFVGWRHTMYLLAALGAVLAIVVIYMMRKTPSAISHGSEKTLKDALISFKGVINHRNSWINALIGFFFFATTGGFASLWGPSFLANNYGLSPESAGFVMSAFFVGQMVGAPLIGWMSDKHQKRTLYLALCSLLGACIMLPLILLTSMPTIALVIIIFTIGFLTAAQLLNYTLAILWHERQGTGIAVAFTDFIVMLSIVIIQPLVGLLLDTFQTGTTPAGVALISVTGYKIAMLLFPLCLLIAFFLTGFLNDKKASTPTL